MSTLLFCFVIFFCTSISPVCAASEDSEWKKCSQSGARAFQQANYGQAERLFVQSVKEAEKFGPQDIRLANSLTNLGVLYSTRGQFAQATPLFERAVAIKQSALGSASPEVVASVGKLCQYYLAHDQFAKSDLLCT